ncbi:hypothetical protein QYF36_009386 [Acer negundo]|nr:hypothetical protein QYF36_009386 [Acer negundo]
MPARPIRPEPVGLMGRAKHGLGGGLISSACKADCSGSSGEAEIDNLLHRQRILALEATSIGDGRLNY